MAFIDSLRPLRQKKPQIRAGISTCEVSKVSPMAGMLPGVECARRRRCYQNKIWSDSPPIAAQISTRRSVLCLYISNHETLLTPNPSLQRSLLAETREDDRLDEVAREAKRRLDKRLRSQTKSEDGRYYSHGV